jgi:trk system potassium uptake protein TrkA
MKGTTFAVIGVGKYGSEIAQKLAKKGAQVYAFDSDEEKIDNIKDDVAFAVTLD